MKTGEIQRQKATGLTTKLSQAEQTLFDNWLKYLAITKDETENNQILFNYFFEKFAAAPQYFYMFLEYFKLQLKTREDCKVLAKKYLEILSPLCDRFNFFEERNLLNDICFEITEPEKYADIRKVFLEYQENSQKIVTEVMDEFDKVMSGKGFEYKLIGRCKNIYSINRKIEKKGKGLLGINDIFGFRIILESDDAEECFKVANILHDKFKPVPDLFKDYITIPKINGYQSLHTGLENVIKGLNIPIEVQIRTKEIDDFAENGLAAHWIYDRKKKAQMLAEKEKRLLDYFYCIAQSSEKEHWIYCFTFEGDIVKLDKDSTIVDFAYKIHTDLGNKLDHALVNGLSKPIYYKVKEGDMIEIITAKKDVVEKKWLNYANSKNAYKKIQEHLKQYA